MQITSLGFEPQTFEAIVDGIVESVKRAHVNMRSGRLYINTGNLLDASVNRSPTAYQNNPASERAMCVSALRILATVTLLCTYSNNSPHT